MKPSAKPNGQRDSLARFVYPLIVGIILTIVSYGSISGSAPSKGQVVFVEDYAALGTLGLTLAVVGAALFIVMSLRRYFRFWLIRLIFEQREQADRIAGR